MTLNLDENLIKRIKHNLEANIDMVLLMTRENGTKLVQITGLNADNTPILQLCGKSSVNPHLN